MDPKKLQEKTDILETNLFKSISKQADPCRVKVDINREHFPDQVILKAIFQLLPRFNVKPVSLMMGLKELLATDSKTGEQAVFETAVSNPESILYADDQIFSRTFKAVATPKVLRIILKGTPAVPSIDGQIAESYFDHEKTAGALLKDGIINFKEINRYPTVKSGDRLFHISPEKQGRPGISFDGKLIPVEEARPMVITIGPGVDKTIDFTDTSANVKGYFLHALKTGVVVIDWDKDGNPLSIAIQDEIEIKRLDYSTGNIGSRFVCPISAKIGIICNGFKINVNGRVQADVSEGAHIETNNSARVSICHRGTTVSAAHDVELASAVGSFIRSESGTVTIESELLDSKIEAPKITFDKPSGLLTNNRITTNNIQLKGLNFSGVNVIYFGSGLFARKKELIKSLGGVKDKLLDLTNNEKILMEKLQVELKKMTPLAQTYPDLTPHIKQVILATKTMNFKTIMSEMDRIQERNNTKPVFQTRLIFEELEKLPKKNRTQTIEKEAVDKQIRDIDREMEFLKLDIEGTLRKGATIKIFCGNLEGKEMAKPDFLIESEGENHSYISVKGSFSHRKGFEIIR